MRVGSFGSGRGVGSPCLLRAATECQKVFPRQPAVFLRRSASPATPKACTPRFRSYFTTPPNTRGEPPPEAVGSSALFGPRQALSLHRCWL